MALDRRLLLIDSWHFNATLYEQRIVYLGFSTNIYDICLSLFSNEVICGISLRNLFDCGSYVKPQVVQNRFYLKKGILERIPAVIEWEVGYIMDRWLACCRVFIGIMINVNVLFHHLEGKKKMFLNVGTECLTHVAVVVVIIRTKSVTLATSWRPVAAQSCMSLIWQTLMFWSKQKQEWWLQLGLALVCFSAALIRMSKSSFLLIELASGGSSADFTSKWVVWKNAV